MGFLTVFIGLLILVLFVFLGLFFLAVVGTARFIISPLGIATAVLGSALWVYQDARRIRSYGGMKEGDLRPATWGLGCLLVWFVFFPLYLMRRKACCERASEQNSLFASLYREELRERKSTLVGIVFVLATIVILMGAFLMLSHWIGPIKITPYM